MRNILENGARPAKFEVCEICLRDGELWAGLKASRNEQKTVAAMEQFLTSAAVDVPAARQRQVKAEGSLPHTTTNTPTAS